MGFFSVDVSFFFWVENTCELNPSWTWKKPSRNFGLLSLCGSKAASHSMRCARGNCPINDMLNLTRGSDPVGINLRTSIHYNRLVLQVGLHMNSTRFLNWRINIVFLSSFFVVILLSLLMG